MTDASQSAGETNRPARTGQADTSTVFARWTLLWLVLLTALAGALRLFHLTAEGLTLDEGFSVFLARTDFANFKHIVWSSQFSMALYYAALRAWLHLGGSEFMIRLPSALSATATVPAVYLLGVRLFSRATGLFAGLFFAIQPANLILSQRARSYPLVILLAALSSLFFLRMLERPTRANRTGYVLFSAAAIYSHFFAVLVVLSQWISLARKGPTLRRKALWCSLLLLAALLVPTAVFLLHPRVAGNVSWVVDLNGRQVLRLLYSLTLRKFPCLCYVALWVVAMARAFPPGTAGRAWSYWFVACWLLIPPLTMIAVSVVRPVLVERYLAVCVPASVLLAAAGLVRLAGSSRTVAAFLLLAVVVYSASEARFYFRHPEWGEDWRGASRYVLAHVKESDEVVIEPYARLTFDYYRQTEAGDVGNFVSNDSLSAPLPTPAPDNIWFIASVLFNPNWRFAKAGEAEAEVQKFLSAQRGCVLHRAASAGNCDRQGLAFQEMPGLTLKSNRHRS